MSRQYRCRYCQSTNTMFMPADGWRDQGVPDHIGCYDCGKYTSIGGSR